jgi:hypothetical protein
MIFDAEIERGSDVDYYMRSLVDLPFSRVVAAQQRRTAR